MISFTSTYNYVYNRMYEYLTYSYMLYLLVVDFVEFTFALAPVRFARVELEDELRDERRARNTKGESMRITNC